MTPGEPRWSVRSRASARWVGGGVLVWALLITWALGTGRYGGPDEPAHITRAAAVADGQVRGAPATGMAGGFRVVHVPAPLASGDPACYRHDARRTAACATAADATGTASVATSAGINPPLFYALVGLPVRWLGDPGDTTWYRIVATAWNALLVVLVLWRVRRGDPADAPWRTLLPLAVLPPAAWFLLGVVNPNGTEVLLALLAWVGVPACAQRARPPSVSECLWVSIPAALAIAVRPIGVLPVLAIGACIGIGSRWSRGWRWSARVASILPPLVASLGVVAWNAWVRLAFDDPRTADPRSRWTIARESIGGTWSTLHEMVGSTSWLEMSMPLPSQVVWIASAAALLVTAWRRGGSTRPQIVVWAAVLLLGPVLFEVATSDRVGLIWQGRYSIPTLVGLAGFALGTAARSTRTVRAIVLAFGAAEVVAFWAVLRRYTVGTDGSWWFSEGAQRAWEPALPARVLLLIHAAAVAAACAHLMYPKRSITTSVAPA